MLRHPFINEYYLKKTKKYNQMNLFILRTNIKTKAKLDSIKSLFNNHSKIIEWSIDLEDIDNVLKVRSVKSFNESDLKNLLNIKGFNCEALPD